MNEFINIEDVIIKTDRLVLRPFKMSDLDDFFEYAKVEGVGERAGWRHHESIEETKEILNMFIEEKTTFAITLNGKVIGSIGIDKYNEKILEEFDDYKVREIGFVLGKNYWNQGIMTEAVREVIRYLFYIIGLDIIVCGHFIENDKSKRVQEKLSFKPYKKCEYVDRLNIKHDSIINILKKSDYL